MSRSVSRNSSAVPVANTGSPLLICARNFCSQDFFNSGPVGTRLSCHCGGHPCLKLGNLRTLAMIPLKSLSIVGRAEGGWDVHSFYRDYRFGRFPWPSRGLHRCRDSYWSVSVELLYLIRPIQSALGPSNSMEAGGYVAATLSFMQHGRTSTASGRRSPQGSSVPL